MHMARSVLGIDSQVILESKATAHYSFEDAEQSASGTLFLLHDGSVAFVTRRLLVFGHEKQHWYDLSDILKVEAYSDGFKAHVLFPETEDEPEQVISYFYEIDGADVDRWVAALTKKPKLAEPPKALSQPPTQPLVIKEREVIREIVKVRCSHCGNLYDERHDKCPHCGGR